MSADACVALISRTRLALFGGRLTVFCTLENFVQTRMTADEMFSRLRPELEEAVRAAAQRDPDAEEVETNFRIGVDIGIADPWLTIEILNPKKCVANLDEHFDRMRIAVARFIATNFPANGPQSLTPHLCRAEDWPETTGDQHA